MKVLKGKYSLSCKLNISFEQGGRHHKVLMTNEPQTLDPFTEWLNFMFKYANIYLKNGAFFTLESVVCNKRINSSLLMNLQFITQELLV